MREHFSLDPALVYLASAAQSMCPSVISRAVTGYRRRYEANPAGGLSEVWGNVWAAQTRLAEFFAADPHDLFLRTSVTVVMSDLILGVELPTDGEILTTPFEYGAIANACRYRAERDGLQLRTMTFSSTPEAIRALTPDAIFDQVLSQIRANTRLVVLSHVVTANGIVFPIERIAAETRRRGILLAVDGAHASGALDLRFDSLSDVDFYGTNLHKWMMGPKATAFGWVPKRNQSLLRPSAIGLGAYDPPGLLHGFASSEFQSRFLMTGVYDFAPFLAISDVIEFWETHGPQHLRSLLRERQRTMMKSMSTRLGWLTASPSHPESRGPIVSYELPRTLRDEGPALAKRLLRDHALQISIPMVGGAPLLRLSPHVYTSDDDLERTMTILEQSISA